jgi:hypothetical protein
MATGDAVDRLRQNGSTHGVTIAGTGRDGLVAVATHPDVELVLCASSGTKRSRRSWRRSNAARRSRSPTRKSW